MEYEITWGESHFDAEIRGSVSLEEAVALVGEILQSPNYFEGIGAVYDVSMADLSDFSVENVISLSETILEVLEVGKHSRVAFVSTRDLNLVLLRFFRVAYKGSKKVFNVFDSMEGARKWLVE